MKWNVLHYRKINIYIELLCIDVQFFEYKFKFYVIVLYVLLRFPFFIRMPVIYD